MALPMFRSLGDASPGEGMETDIPLFPELQTPFLGAIRNTSAPGFQRAVRWTSRTVSDVKSDLRPVSNVFMLSYSIVIQFQIEICT
eukprot:1401911-Pyramimonas_sp.AAC.1